jgi:GNAT superfamily N-acetyltransferase
VELLMRAVEFEGIGRASPDVFTGGKEDLSSAMWPENAAAYPLPGGSGFVYTIDRDDSYTSIQIWDPQGADYVNAPAKPKRLPGQTEEQYKRRLARRKWEIERNQKTPGQSIGTLSTISAGWFPLKKSLQVETITVDEDYRGQGIATSLYGIVLTIMKRPLLAGGSQTPGGRGMWVNLASIPGVVMKGYVGLENYELDPNMTTDKNNLFWSDTAQNKQSEKNIDIIMGQLGGDYIGQSPAGRQLFAFDVKPNTTGKELEAHVKTRLSKIYGDTDLNSGLYAVWSGA